MKRSPVKDILTALLPALLFEFYGSGSRLVMSYCQRYYLMFPIYILKLVPPALFGALLMMVAMYIWVNRASLVFIYPIAGVVLTNMIVCVKLLLGYAGRPYMNSYNILTLYCSETAMMFIGAYLILFVISLVSFIRSKTRRIEIQ